MTTTTTSAPHAAELRSRIKQLQAELAADPERKIMRVRGVPVGAGPHRTREVVQGELDDALAMLPDAEERERVDEQARLEQERLEQERRERRAHQRATAAARDAAKAEAALDAAYAELDALIAASPIARILDAQGERHIAATAFHAALAVLGPVALHADGMSDAHYALLDQLGPEAGAARRALHVEHPAREHAQPRELRYARLIEHWLTPPPPPDFIGRNNPGGAS